MPMCQLQRGAVDKNRGQRGDVGGGVESLDVDVDVNVVFGPGVVGACRRRRLPCLFGGLR